MATDYPEFAHYSGEDGQPIAVDGGLTLSRF